jgi:hypothetical protein
LHQHHGVVHAHIDQHILEPGTLARKAAAQCGLAHGQGFARCLRRPVLAGCFANQGAQTPRQPRCLRRREHAPTFGQRRQKIQGAVAQALVTELVVCCAGQQMLQRGCQIGIQRNLLEGCARLRSILPMSRPRRNVSSSSADSVRNTDRKRCSTPPGVLHKSAQVLASTSSKDAGVSIPMRWGRNPYPAALPQSAAPSRPETKTGACAVPASDTAEPRCTGRAARWAHPQAAAMADHPHGLHRWLPSAGCLMSCLEGCLRGGLRNWLRKFHGRLIFYCALVCSDTAGFRL